MMIWMVFRVIYRAQSACMGEVATQKADASESPLRAALGHCFLAAIGAIAGAASVGVSVRITTCAALPNRERAAQRPAHSAWGPRHVVGLPNRGCVYY